MKVFALIIMLLSAEEPVYLKKSFITIEDCVREGVVVKREHKENIQLVGCFEEWRT